MLKKRGKKEEKGNARELRKFQHVIQSRKSKYVVGLWYIDAPTLEYPISIGVRLLIFPKFSTQHALIPYHTFINFNINFQPIRLFHTVCFSYSIFFAYFSLGRR